MPTIVHIIDVGQGNMVLVTTDDGCNFMFDCNITDENEGRILSYVERHIFNRKCITAFICSHRDADHIRGIEKLHYHFPIKSVWDSDYPGTSTNTSEYRSYMDVRRSTEVRTIKRKTYKDFGKTRFRYLSAKDERLPKNPNAQGIVIKVEHRANGIGSIMLPGDSDAQTWRCGIMADYGMNDISSSLLLASHHGSLSFFDDPNDRYYYEEHLRAVAPAMTFFSVGPNPHGHPEEKAIEFYEQYSKGSNRGNKLFRTDKHGTIRVTLKDGGAWSASPRQ